MKRRRLAIRLDLLSDALLLPDDCKVIAVRHQTNEQRAQGIAELILESDEFEMGSEDIAPPIMAIYRHGRNEVTFSHFELMTADS